MKLATLKTENAKLLGSQQALSAIREQLSQENSRLCNRERERDSHWQQEREKLTNQLNSITAEAQQLKTQLAQQREQLMVGDVCPLVWLRAFVYLVFRKVIFYLCS
jgi:predicted RNase H-like nuclease (RuvC/YqgF family)